MNRWITSAAVVCALCTGVAVAEDAERTPSPEAVKSFASLSLTERRAFVAKTDRAEVEALLRAMTVDEMLDSAAERIAELGTYSGTLNKQERVKGDLLDPQVIKVVVREKPFAVRMDYAKGPGAGRRVLYNASSTHPKEIRVRESGLFSIAGALWIDVDSNLTRKESNHPVTHMGIGPLVQLVKKDADVFQHQGFIRTNEPLKANNEFCVLFEPPARGAAATAPTTHMCFDAASGIPTSIVVKDAKGLRERYDWTDVKPTTVAKNYFTPEGAGL